jgi:hypothetical protein
MKKVIFAFGIATLISPALAQLTAPTRTLAPITDPTMIVIDRGSKLEVFPNQRAINMIDSTGRVVARQVSPAAADSPISVTNLGVVFNHAMQQQGYISGEIAFKMKAGPKLSGFSSSLYPGLKKITNPEVYVVNARTPAEFMTVLKRLQARGDLEWVEPTVIYGSAKPNPTIR